MTDFLKKHEWMDPDNRVKNRPLREPAVIQDLDLAMRQVLLLLQVLLPLQVCICCCLCWCCFCCCCCYCCGCR